VLTILDLNSEFAKLKMRGPVVTAREWRRDRTGRRRATTFDIMTDGWPAILHAQGEDGGDRAVRGMAPFRGSDSVSLIATTPQPTQHLTFAIDDPRKLE
jgi:hypothetical protein